MAAIMSTSMAFAQAPSPAPPSSDPGKAVALLDFFVFAATDPLHGRELWSYHCPDGPVQLVKDIVPGPEGSDPKDFLNASGGVAFFSARTPEHGRELWQIDFEDLKLRARLAKDIQPGPASSEPLPLGTISHLLVLYAGSVQHGQELWLAGNNFGEVTLLKDILPGPAGSRPMGSSSAPAGLRLLLYAIDGSDQGITLWSTDGTPPGSLRLADVDDYSYGPTGVAEGYFLGQNHPTHGTELWYAPDATSPPDVIKDINPGIDPSNPEQITAWNGKALFRAFTPAEGKELYLSDGTAQGTQLLKDINPGPASSEPGRFTPVSGEVYFIADDGTHGQELWRTAGTPETTALVFDVRPGPEGSGIFSITSHEYGIAFSADDGQHGEELWGSFLDGSTRLLADIYTGPGHSGPHEMQAGRTHLIFGATHPEYGRELWRLDPATGEVTLAGDINTVPAPNPSSSPREITPFKNIAFMAAYDTIFGEELWCIRAPGDAGFVRDIYPGTASSGIAEITAGDDGVWFRAEDGEHGSELWFSDGTEGGTHMVLDIAGGGSATPAGLFYSAGCLYFSATSPGTGNEPYRLCADGPPAILADIAPGKASSDPADFTEVGGIVYFVADDQQHGRELWHVLISGEVRLVLDITASPKLGSMPEHLRKTGLGLLYSSDSHHRGREPWLLKSGENTPRLVTDIRR